ncbi:hypothetical protein [Halomonas mongoliensis]|uniref:hypothetical protein n=1 Tax=Halomonas mongoliensis TaxID=321265 RepID=UPI00403B0574
MKRHDVVAVTAERPGASRPAAGILLATVLLVASTSLMADSREAGSDRGFAALEQLDLESMASTRGREGTVMHFKTAQSIQNMQAIVSDTQVSVVNGDMVSGNIRFDNNAMGNYNGTGIFSAVTGHGNAINNAVGISVFISAD